MNDPEIAQQWAQQAILDAVRSILHDLIADYDQDFSGEIGPQTWLSADLMLDSLTLVAMIVEIEGCFRCKGLPFDEILLVDGGYVEDIQVCQLVSFLDRHLNGPEASAQP
jgi:acyl carrier protein